jgi:hypothetical protein
MKTMPLLYYYVSAGLCTIALFVQLLNWSSYRGKENKNAIFVIDA